MARVTIDDDILTDVADAIRDKTETTDSISPLNFASLIESISGGGSGGGVEIGEITPINTSTSVNIETELSEVHGIVFTRENTTNFANCDLALLAGVIDGGYSKDGYSYGCCVRSNWGNIATSYASSQILTVEDGIITVSSGSGFITGSNFTKGITYKYIIF